MMPVICLPRKRTRDFSCLAALLCWVDGNGGGTDATLAPFRYLERHVGEAL